MVVELFNKFDHIISPSTRSVPNTGTQIQLFLPMYSYMHTHPAKATSLPKSILIHSSSSSADVKIVMLSTNLTSVLTSTVTFFSPPIIIPTMALSLPVNSPPESPAVDIGISGIPLPMAIHSDVILCIGSLRSTELRLVSRKTPLTCPLTVAVERVNDFLMASPPLGLVNPYALVRGVPMYPKEQLPVRSRPSCVNSLS